MDYILMSLAFITALTQGTVQTAPKPGLSVNIPFDGTVFQVGDLPLNQAPNPSIPSSNIHTDTKYNAFGTSIVNPLNADQILYFPRTGIDHNGDANDSSVMMIFDIVNNLRSDYIEVIPPDGFVRGDTEILVRGNRIHAFWSSFNINTIASRTAFSDDGGQTFSAPVDLETWIPGDQKAHVHYSRGFFDGTFYYQPYYEYTAQGLVDGWFGVWRTLDGVNWTKIQLNATQASLPWNETAMIQLDTNQYYFLSRKFGGTLWASTSTDMSALSATTPAATNLGVGTSMADLETYLTFVSTFYQQRAGTRGIYYSQGLKTDIWSAPTVWPTPALVVENNDGVNGLGYPCRTHIQGNQWFLIYHRETSSSETETVFFKIQLPTS